MIFPLFGWLLRDYKGTSHDSHLNHSSLIVGFLIGLVVALIRVYKVKYLYRVANGYVSFFRGTPIIMHIMLIYFGFPLLIDQISVKFDLGIESNSIPIILFVLIAFH